MRYLGSKNRIAKHILPIILADRKLDQWYVEPFVGGANLIDKVAGKRIGNDINHYLIELLKEMQSDHFNPPTEVDELEYKAVQHFPQLYENWYIGYIGFNLSFGAKFFGGYCRSKKTTRSHVSEAFRNTTKQAPNLKGIIFTCGHYYEMQMPENSIVYCDPPYQNTTGYKHNIDHNHFWQWCRDKKKEGHEIFISGYTAPEDFVCVWHKELNSGGHLKKAVEKLYTLLG